MKKVAIYTDGACFLNQGGVGGWAAKLMYEGTVREIYGGELATTNNRMEMMGVIMGLRVLKTSCNVQVYTDSQYVQKGMSVWKWIWERNNWITKQGGPVKNQDLWQDLSVEMVRHMVSCHWVRGHAGDHHNERCDALAVKAALEMKKGNLAYFEAMPHYMVPENKVVQIP